ncbi:Choline dehydrogenase [Phytophthora nicotianae]|uniref:Choline dehydrogenase n=1 Tax=Phytophthora nicotianae TaxID=4792 RepID=A0A0W8BZY7_PHYNI|nr:Choline dehydrogenase [Phytophthora nicotianae]KUF87383.1 Choline dehydrogenase [Phytophthora nicotianae]
MLRRSLQSKTLVTRGRHAVQASFARALSSSATSAEYDYVIVGGGSAGCVLANRLSADPTNKVLLVESGPSDVGKWDSVRIHMPAALAYNLADDRYNWDYYTEPQKNLDGRRIPWPRGRVLGGSSSINAMVYNRGHAFDFDDWEKSGAKGWSYADCLPYFKKSTTHDLGEDDYRGGNGPIRVTRKTQDKAQPLFQAFIDAGVQAGYPEAEDMNGYQQEGLGWMDMTIHKGKRWSAAAGYLHPAMDRKNLTVITDTFVNKVIFEGKKAVGIEVEDNKSKTVSQIRTAKEIVLSSGAINTPQLLMLSGVGDAEHLKEMNIPLVHHLPAIGKNMEDHLGTYLHFECKKPITLYNATWRFPHKMVAIALEWLTSQTGPGSSSQIEAGGFIRTAPGKTHPDLQYHFLPGSIDEGLHVRAGHVMTGHCSTMRATSRGYIKLRSKNPRQHPIMEPNYLDTHEDIVDIRNGVKLTREIFKQKAFDEFRGDALSPSDSAQTNEEIDAWVRQNAGTVYHPSCTARMGEGENTAVDSETRVHGMEGLRIVDASIMPNIVSGNLNGPVIMMAEKAADIILGNPALPKSTAPVYQAKNWETNQR